MTYHRAWDRIVIDNRWVDFATQSRLGRACVISPNCIQRRVVLCSFSRAL